MSMRLVSSLVGMCLVLGLSACDDDKDDSTSGTTDTGETDGTTGEPECMKDADCPSGMMCSANMCTESFWAVGGDGTVLRAGMDGEVSPEPPRPDDLRDIVCRGISSAWAVGDGAMLIHSDDGGETWTSLAVPTKEDLVAVSAGDQAVVTVSTTGDVFWSETGQGFHLSASLERPATAVAVASGETAVVAGADGSLTAVQDTGTVAWQLTVPAALRGVAVSDDGSRIVAVGDGGAMYWSASGPGGLEQIQDAGPHLRDVQLSHDGDQAIAVGDEGCIVHVTDGVVSMTESQAGAAALRAVHLDADGQGAAVGLGGVVAVTQDFGQTFQVVHEGGADLLGVDAVGVTHW